MSGSTSYGLIRRTLIGLMTGDCGNDPTIAPIFVGIIPNFTFMSGLPIVPITTSAYFNTGGAVSTYTVNDLPSGLVINSLTGRISGIPSSSGILGGIIVTGTNAIGLDSSNAFIIEVTNGCYPSDVSYPSDLSYPCDGV